MQTDGHTDDISPAVNSAPPELPTAPASVSRRLALVSALCALVIGLAAFVVLAPVEQATIERIAIDQIGLVAETVAASYQGVDAIAPDATDVSSDADGVAKRFRLPRPHQADEILAQLSRASGIAAIDVTDHLGVVVRSTQRERVGEKVRVSQRLRDADVEANALWVSYAIPFTQSCAACHARENDPIGIVRVQVTRAAALSSLDRFHLVYGIAASSAFLALLIAVIVATNRLVSRRIARLSDTMARAERGDFLARARVGRADEIGRLESGFNRMLRAITTMKAQEIEHAAQLQEASEQLAFRVQLETAAQQLQETNAALSRRVRAQGVLMEAAHRLGSTLDKTTLVDRLARVILDKLEQKDFAIFLVAAADVAEGSGDAELRVAYAAGALDTDDVRASRFRTGEGFTGLVAETGAPVLIPDLTEPPANHRHTQRGPMLSSGSLLAVPMLHHGRVVGVLDCYASAPHAFDSEDVALFSALGAQAAMAVVNADLYQTTLELAVTDTLTGLMNRRALNRVLEAELVRAQRFATPLVLMMIDVDHFKNYNDRMGHLLGDEALRAVADTLTSSIRKVDAVARFGGEEFCVVLPRTDEASGLEVAEKLLRNIRAVHIAGAPSQPLGHMSVSVGLAVYPIDVPQAVDGLPVQALIDAADQATYEAKRRGRDRAVLASEVSGRARRPERDEPQRS